MCLKLKYERYILITIMWSCKQYLRANNTFWHHRYLIYHFVCTEKKPAQTLTPLYEVQKAAILSHKVKNKNINPNLRCNNRRNGDKIDTLDTHTLLFTFLTGFRQNQDGYQMVIQLLSLMHTRIELVFEYKRWMT